MSSPKLAPLSGAAVAQTDGSSLRRIERGYLLRMQEACGDAFAAAPSQIDNGDEARYSDKSGTYTKGVVQSGLGLVDLAAYQAFKKALTTGDPRDFQNIPIGGRTLNGPQGSLAFYLGCLDATQFPVPPAPALASEAYAAELIECYWASLLRDVAFTDFPSNSIAADAAAELSSLSEYAGPRDSSGHVTPNLLFRGGFGGAGLGNYFTGETIGPYISQFLLQPTALGSLPITQQYASFAKGIDFVLNDADFLKVQNGQDTGNTPTNVPPVFMHDGRGLGAYTHDDVLYQAYFIALLVLTNPQLSNNMVNFNLNPGSPYAPGKPDAKNQNGFATLGAPDMAASLAAVAVEALKAVWYQKWIVHLRHRPESGGGIVNLMKTGRANTIQGQVSNTVLNSKALAASAAANGGSFYLSQAFPEGSPTHPAYPTGHGTVAGACITVLKFFFDGSSTFANPQVPSSDGTTLHNYIPPSGESPLTVAGELHKLAHNISFGHGIHAGIHWRSDTDQSILLGEAVALSYLRDRARTYNEHFAIEITKLDGTTTTITNP